MSAVAGPPTRAQLARRTLSVLPDTIRSRPSGRFTVGDLIERSAARWPDRTAVAEGERKVTYRELNAQANRVARWALRQHLGPGSVVGLLVENRPEYLSCWLGLAKIGAITALLNTNLRGDALAHSIGSSGCELVLVGEECHDAWGSLDDDVPEVVWVRDEHTETRAGVGAETRDEAVRWLDEECADLDDTDPPRSVRAELTSGDPLFYIFTSGTTGLPKAARLSHSRYLGGGLYAVLAGLGPDDVLYCPLPLYHTVGGVMSTNGVLRTGATLALARGFSASGFWDDVARHGATAFQYIGELCRYLVNQPPHPLERRHAIRFALGNGLRPDVWPQFQERFGIPLIVEFYGATESNVAMVNLAGRVGSVGKAPPGVKIALVRYDRDAGEVVRGSDGRCIPCDVGEPGELLGKIAEGSSAAGRFEGYTSDDATERKILRDVFEEGDAWFRTGDLLRRDADGYHYFVDRVGDTFRWKGENVSTQEVADALSTHPDVGFCAVYGVEIPGSEGRAGMAAVVTEPGAELDGAPLYEHLADALPAYAMPAFVRLQDEPSLTGTLKLRKVELQEQGFDPDLVDDPVLVRDDDRRAYVALDDETMARVGRGELRF